MYSFASLSLWFVSWRNSNANRHFGYCQAVLRWIYQACNRFKVCILFWTPAVWTKNNSTKLKRHNVKWKRVHVHCSPKEGACSRELGWVSMKNNYSCYVNSHCVDSTNREAAHKCKGSTSSFQGDTSSLKEKVVIQKRVRMGFCRQHSHRDKQGTKKPSLFVNFLSTKFSCAPRHSQRNSGHKPVA